MENKNNEELEKLVIELRNKGLNYNEIKKQVEISEDELKTICRKYKMNNSNFYRKPSEDEIKRMQELYDECGSCIKVAKIIGWSKPTVLKYIKTKDKLTREENKEKRKKDNVKNVVNWRKDKKEKLVAYKGGKCEKCGYDKCITALNFHHLDPEKKEFSISSSSFSYEKLLKEVDKCILLCANCHKEIHEEE